MGKYAIQSDDYSCGPTALYNLLKYLEIKEFLGHKVDKHIIEKVLKPLCKCTEEDPGTYTQDFRCALRIVPGIYCVCIRTNKVERLREHLKSRKAAVISYKFKDKNTQKWHYALMLPSKKYIYVGINLYAKAGSENTPILRYKISKKWEAKELERELDEVWLIYKQWEE